MGVIAVFGGVRSTFTVTCARIMGIIMGIDGVFNSGKNLLRFKSQVGRVFYIRMWHLALLFCSIALEIGPCKIVNSSLYAALSKRRKQSGI
jgi:hypothetical protein